MVSFDFLTKPIDLSHNKVSVLYIENQQLYRNTLLHFYEGYLEENGIIFSENYTPVKMKGNICFLPNLFTMDFSSAFMKKIYDDLSKYVNSCMMEELATIRSILLDFFDHLSSSFDYDFEFHEEVDIIDLLKMQCFKPSLSKDNLLSALLDYIVLTTKYSSIKCFVLPNLHPYFTLAELDTFYHELNYQNVNLLVIENKKCFETLSAEKVYIVDEDMCEIIEN